MAEIKRRFFSLRMNGRTFELVSTRLDPPSYRIYKQKHLYPKSMFYLPERWEYAIEFGRRKISLHYKRDL